MSKWLSVVIGQLLIVVELPSIVIGWPPLQAEWRPVVVERLPFLTGWPFVVLGYRSLVA